MAGDTAAVDVLGRDRMRGALTGATAADRIAAGAAAACQIIGRAGELFAVAQRAAGIEPMIALYREQGRAQTRLDARGAHGWWAARCSASTSAPKSDSGSHHTACAWLTWRWVLSNSTSRRGPCSR
jgi:hypothetical protein